MKQLLEIDVAFFADMLLIEMFKTTIIVQNNSEVPLNEVKNFVFGDHSDYCFVFLCN